MFCICSSLFLDETLPPLAGLYVRRPSIPGICRFLSTPPPCRRPAGGFSHVFSRVLRLCCPLYRRGLASPWYLFCGWFAVEPFLPPPPHRCYAAGSESFPAPPPAIPAVRGKFLMGGFCLVVGSAYFSSPVPSSIARPLEVREWVLRSHTFDSWSSS